MVRHWNHQLPPLPDIGMQISWVDWIVPWVIFFVAAIFFAWVLSNFKVNTLDNIEDNVSAPVELGHPSLDRAWSKAKKEPLHDYDDSPYYPY